MQKFIAYFDRALTDTDGTLTLSFAVKGAEKKKAMECVQEMQKLKLQGKERLTRVKQYRKQGAKCNDYAWVIGKISKNRRTRTIFIEVYIKNWHL